MKKSLVLSLALLFALPVVAGDDVKTLPAAMYDTMKSGKKLDKVFVDPSYDKSKGFKLGEVEFRAESLNSTVIDGMKKSMAMITKREAPYTLHVVVVKVTTKTFTGFGNLMGKVFIEGRIVDENGKLVAAFLASERAGTVGMGADDYQVACDKIATDVAKDLR